MPTELREKLNDVRSAYQELTYDGDLASELLPRPQPAIRWRWPLLASAVAAMVTITIWHRAPTPSPTPPQAIVVKTQPTSDVLRHSLLAIRDIHYEAYVEDVHTGVKQAVHSLSGTVDIALTAPVVKDSVQKVGEVTDDIKEIASNTWSQVRALPKPPC